MDKNKVNNTELNKTSGGRLINRDVNLKKCPACGGELVPDTEVDGVYVCPGCGNKYRRRGPGIGVTKVTKIEYEYLLKNQKQVH